MNIIKLEDEIPYHKASFLIGVIIGLGIKFEIEPESPLYRVLRERNRITGLELRGEKDRILKEGCVYEEVNPIR